jgi:hypothetical protein
MKRDSDAKKGSAWEDCLRILRMNISDKIRIRMNQIIIRYFRYLLVIYLKQNALQSNERTNEIVSSVTKNILDSGVAFLK